MIHHIRDVNKFHVITLNEKWNVKFKEEVDNGKNEATPQQPDRHIRSHTHTKKINNQTNERENRDNL